MVKSLEVRHEAFLQYLSYRLLFISYLKAKVQARKRKVIIYIGCTCSHISSSQLSVKHSTQCPMLYHEKGLFIGTNFWWWFFCTSRGGFSIVWGFWNLILIKLVHLSVTIHVELNMSSKMYFKWPTYCCWKAVIFCPLFLDRTPDTIMSILKCYLLWSCFFRG